MRIVYIIDHLRPDGAQRFLQQLVEGLAHRGHNQLIICLNDEWDEEVMARLRNAPAEVRVVGKLCLASGYGLFMILCWLQRGHFDVAVTLLFVSDVVGRTLARISRVRRIITSIRTRDEFYSGWQRFMVGLTMRWADVVVLNSANVREFAITNEKAPANRITVIPNGVRVQDYTTPISRAALRAELNLPPDTPLVGSVGRLTHQKGYDVLMNALKIADLPELHVLIAGVGEDQPDLLLLAKRLGLSHQVHFVGYRRDVPRWLGALDLYIQPSRYEGMPNALLEAMASSCPVICTAVDGNLELIEHGTHGWLVAPEDPDGLTVALCYLLKNPEEAQRCGANARQRVLDEYSVDTMVAAWENVLLGQR